MLSGAEYPQKQTSQDKEAVVETRGLGVLRLHRQAEGVEKVFPLKRKYSLCGKLGCFTQGESFHCLEGIAAQKSGTNFEVAPSQVLDRIWVAHPKEFNSGCCIQNIEERLKVVDDKEYAKSTRKLRS